MRHQSIAGHLQATVLSKTFGETRVNLQLSEQVHREFRNKKVKKDREILKRLRECVIFFLFGQTGTFISHRDKMNTRSKTRRNYVKLRQGFT